MVPTAPSLLFTSFQPTPTRGAAVGGCLTCSHFFGERVAHGAHVVCRRKGVRQVQANPRHGCAFWQREPGADG